MSGLGFQGTHLRDGELPRGVRLGVRAWRRQHPRAPHYVVRQQLAQDTRLGRLRRVRSRPCVLSEFVVTVEGLGIQSSGFRIKGSGFGVWGLGFRVEGERFRV